MEPNKISFTIFGHLYNFILIKQNWLTIKNKKLFLILYEKEEANWPSVAQRGRGPRAKAAHGRGSRAHAGVFTKETSYLLQTTSLSFHYFFLSLTFALNPLGFS